MTYEEAKLTLLPDTMLFALAEYEYFGGGNGRDAKIKAVEEAYIKACEAIDKVLASQWVPVSERLPSDMNLDWVLVCVVEDNGHKWEIPQVAEYRKALDDWYIEGVGWLQTGLNGFFVVTHWMPLPEPPKEGTT